ncbi:hypothetical protein M438DRAFT_159596 [Aureobasidium pullulans EXF-150]|uniref:Uncharacterized protein n=1 Tax=Aureobasidium pullulans EXF-150 TaxID=1043002 RepID=A0A074YJ72_AURPU|nr:uncharacterized protein M438DRAFT_159596 [Aureobasidium pullulans EXF-150]KEQ86966.1 hypothetical protein M438DRAFT_159596 [Aureobasidium pullulans EXF-150]
MYELYPYWSGCTALASLATRCLAAETEQATSSQENSGEGSRSQGERSSARCPRLSSTQLRSSPPVSSSRPHSNG